MSDGRSTPHPCEYLNKNSLGEFDIRGRISA